MTGFYDNSLRLLVVDYFRKNSIMDVWEGRKYASVEKSQLTCPVLGFEHVISDIRMRSHSNWITRPLTKVCEAKKDKSEHKQP